MIKICMELIKVYALELSFYHGLLGQKMLQQAYLYHVQLTPVFLRIYSDGAHSLSTYVNNWKEIRCT